jgi:hypothetical protein
MRLLTKSSGSQSSSDNTSWSLKQLSFVAILLSIAEIRIHPEENGYECQMKVTRLTHAL